MSKRYELVELADFAVLVKGYDGKPYLSTLNSTDPKHKPLLVKALGFGDFSGKECDGLDMLVEHVVIREGTIEDEATGEVKPCLFTSLLSPAGECYGFAAEGVCYDLRSIGLVYGPPPWRPALVLRTGVRVRPSGRPIRWLQVLRQLEV